MHCFEMKLKNRFRADRKHQSYSTSSSALLNNREASSSLDKDSRLPVDKGMDSPVPPKRDRSRSLCVDRIGPLIQVEPKASDDATKTTAIFARRCSTNALSASSDFISRRGVFSRRHYGSVEMLPQIETEGNELNGRRFRVENGESHGDREEMYGSPTTPVLENPEYQTRWYFKYFLGKLHQNYVGIDYDKAPFFLSVVLSNANNQRVPQYHAILWRKTGAQKISLCYTPNKPMTVKLILSNFTNMEKLEKGPKEIFSQDIQKDLLLLEEQEGSVNFKFGILYMLPGQTSDDEILSNEKGSKQFDNFLNLLGDKIRLKGWDKYRGGLDVKGDMTGKYSIYTVYEGHEVMFHVSTLLPFSRDNKQQVERKRHIGNDIVNIVFLDQTTDAAPNFSPSFIRSQFTHVFALVSLCALDNSYRLQVFSEETVPLFGSSLPSPAIFTNHQEFREFLLVKLINGEKATFNTPTFSQKRERTLEMLIKDICQEHMSETRGTMLNRRAFSDVLPDPPRSSRRKEEARQVEFVRYGQALKLDTIVRGDAPTSLATTGLFKRTPWEPLCCYPDFPYEIVCGDSWGTSRLFVASAEGVYLIEEGLQHKAVFDRSVVVKQLNVAEAHGILLIRVDKGRDSKIHVFRLSDFESDINVGNEEKLRSKVDIKEHRLERTKGCHLYSISKPGGSHLRMVVVVGKKLLILQWRHSAAWTAWCPASDTDTVEGFLFLREISLPETPSLLTLIDSPFASSAGGLNDNQICVGYKHHWDLVSERTGESSRLYCVEASKINLVAAIDIYEDDEAELLLCNNNICHFQKLSSPDSSSEFDFHWNSVPTAIVCAFPYIMAFTHDSIEIRLVINGNLVQTMVMPSLTFITSKADIFFATTAPEFISLQQDAIKVDKTERDSSLSPPPSPTSREVSGERAFSFERDFSPGSSGNSATQKPFRIYRIPFASMTGIGRCDRRCPTPSTHLHQNVLPGEGNRNVGPSKDNNKEIKDRKNEKESEKNYNKDEGEDESKSEMHLQVGNQSYSSRSCSASPTRHLGALPPFPPSANKNTPLSPLKCPSNSPARGTTRQRNRTNSLTVEMGSFPFRPIPQKHSFTHHNQQTPK